MENKKLCDKELEKISGGIAEREPEEDLTANKPDYTTIKDEDLLKEMKLPDFNLT